MEDQWIVNAHGVVQSVPADAELLPGARPATPAEVTEFQEADAIVAAQNKAAAEAQAYQESGAPDWFPQKRKRVGWC